MLTPEDTLVMTNSNASQAIEFTLQNREFFKTLGDKTHDSFVVAEPLVDRLSELIPAPALQWAIECSPIISPDLISASLLVAHHNRQIAEFPKCSRPWLLAELTLRDVHYKVPILRGILEYYGPNSAEAVNLCTSLLANRDRSPFLILATCIAYLTDAGEFQLAGESLILLDKEVSEKVVREVVTRPKFLPAICAIIENSLVAGDNNSIQLGSRFLIALTTFLKTRKGPEEEALKLPIALSLLDLLRKGIALANNSQPIRVATHFADILTTLIEYFSGTENLPGIMRDQQLSGISAEILSSAESLPEQSDYKSLWIGLIKTLICTFACDRELAAGLLQQLERSGANFSMIMDTGCPLIPENSSPTSKPPLNAKSHWVSQLRCFVLSVLRNEQATKILIDHLEHSQTSVVYVGIAFYMDFRMLPHVDSQCAALLAEALYDHKALKILPGLANKAHLRAISLSRREDSLVNIIMAQDEISEDDAAAILTVCNPKFSNDCHPLFPLLMRLCYRHPTTSLHHTKRREAFSLLLALSKKIPTTLAEKFWSEGESLRNDVILSLNDGFPLSWRYALEILKSNVFSTIDQGGRTSEERSTLRSLRTACLIVVLRQWKDRPEIAQQLNPTREWVYMVLRQAQGVHIKAVLALIQSEDFPF